MDKVNSMAGGGKESEKKEDGLDKGMTSLHDMSSILALLHHVSNMVLTAHKGPPSYPVLPLCSPFSPARRQVNSDTDNNCVTGVDFVQEKFLGQGPQDNESAIEQAKDEQISDFIRGKYKGTTGSDFPIADK